MNEFEELKKKLMVTQVKSLQYDRKRHDFVQKHTLVLHTKDNPEAVEKVKRISARSGALFEGEFEKLPVNERQRLYNEAKKKAKKAMKWWEYWCNECGKPINLFNKKVFRTVEWHTINESKVEEVLEMCADCQDERYFDAEEEITDQLLAGAIERGKPICKFLEDVGILIVGKDQEVLIKQKNPLAFEALKKFGSVIK